ncbi:MAG: ABC transporter permease [Gammaproteobacteria bacterium]|nr:ABC transporter permease [Gammaproteobacteria bacterium]
MLSHFTKMALKALMRFKLHTIISLASLVIGFLCFVSAILLSNYASSFDRHFPNAGNIYNLMIRAVGDSPLPDRFPVVNQPTARYMRTAFPEIPNIARATTGFPQDVTVNGLTVALDAKFVEPRFFDIFPLETIYGIDTGQELPPNSVMISESAAQRVFGRTDVVGERLLLANKHDLMIVGVAATLEYPSHLNLPSPSSTLNCMYPWKYRIRKSARRSLPMVATRMRTSGVTSRTLFMLSFPRAWKSMSTPSISDWTISCRLTCHLNGPRFRLLNC